MQKGPEMYSRNAPFPMACGIPNTEPLNYNLSSLATTSIAPLPNVDEGRPQRTSYYHPKPRNTFKFTTDNPRLTTRQRQFYEENGFVVIPKLVPEDLLDHCRERFLDIVDGKVAKGGITMMRDVSLKVIKNKDKNMKEKILFKFSFRILWVSQMNVELTKSKILYGTKNFPNSLPFHKF